MFGFGKKPLIAEVPFEFSPYNSDAYNKGKYTVQNNGAAYSGKYQLGTVPGEILNYAKTIGGETFSLRPTPSYGCYFLMVYGDKVEEDISPIQNGGKEYTYRCGVIDACPAMIPSTEYFVDMQHSPDHYDVYFHGEKIGTVKEAEGRDRIKHMARMLHTGFTATAQVEWSNRGVRTLYVTLRKV